MYLLRLSVLNFSDKECPDGMEYRGCGPLCPYTCNTYFGTDPCFSLHCAPGGCFCPHEYVMADGRCTRAEEACTGQYVITVEASW